MNRPALLLIDLINPFDFASGESSAEQVERAFVETNGEITVIPLDASTS